MALANNVKRLRKERGWSQAELAAKIGAHLNHVNKIENGKYMPSFDTVMKLANVLEVSLDYLAGDSNGGPEEVKIENQAFAAKIQLLNTLDEEERQTVIKIIDTMLTKKKMIGMLKDLEE